MGRMGFRSAIFNVIEYLTKKPLSNQGEKLIIHYFNESREDESYGKALDAITRYCSDDFPSGDAMPDRLRKMLSALKREAAEWDAE